MTTNTNYRSGSVLHPPRFYKLHKNPNRSQTETPMTTDMDGKEGKLSDTGANQEGNGPCNSAKTNSDCLLD